MDLGDNRLWYALAAVIVVILVLTLSPDPWASTTAATVGAEPRSGRMFLLRQADIALAARL